MEDISIVQCNHCNNNNNNINNLESNNNNIDNNNNNCNHNIDIENIKINDTTTTVQFYDNKCIHHPNQDIIYLCTDCNNYPSCIQCVALDSFHRGHKVDLIHLENSRAIYKDFKERQYPNLNSCLETDKELEQESNNHFQSIQEKYNENVLHLKNEFKQLHNIIDTIEAEAIEKLTKCYNENKDLNTTIKSNIDSNTRDIKLIVEKHRNVINSNYEITCDTTTNQHIEIIKHNQISKKLIDDNKYKNKIIDKYNATSIIFNQSLTETIKESIKFYYYTISSKSVTFKDLKKLTLGNEIFKIYEDGYTITDDITCLALGKNVTNLNALKLAKNLISILILEGFSLQLSAGSLPNNITTLYISSIEKPLVMGSIPQSCRYLYLLNGFNQEITKGVIPSSVEQLFIGSVKHSFANNTIPSTIKQIHRVAGVPLTIHDSKWSGPFSSRTPAIWSHPIIVFNDTNNDDHHCEKK